MKNFHQLTVEPGRRRRWKDSERKHRNGKPTGRGFRHTGDEVEEDMNTLKVPLQGTRFIPETQQARFGPVKRWLKSHVGQPWNKLWSEICKMEGKEFDRYHMRRHFKDFVYFETEHKVPDSRYFIFFGSPFIVGADGILRENIMPKRPEEAKPPTGEIPDPNNPMAVYFRTEKGLWYHIIRKPAKRYVPTYDADGKFISGKWVESTTKFVTASKKQVSAKMVKQLELEKRYWS